MSLKTLLLTSLAVCLLTPIGTLAQTLKIATLAPDGTTWMQEMRRGGQEIRRRTGGQVRLKFYPGGVMGNSATVLRKIHLGQLQGGAFTGTQLAGIYPDAQIYSLPLLFRSYDEVDYVRRSMDPLIRAGLAAKGLAAVGISDGGFAYVMCTRPLRNIEDLKGQKVWIPQGDRVSQTVLETAGISPISLPIADVYTGLQTGLLDTVTSIPTGTIAFQWHTKLTHLTDFPLMFLIGMLVIDRHAFERLSLGHQQVVSKVMGEVFRHLDRLNREDNRKAKQALVDQGMRLVYPSPAELTRWQVVADRAIQRLGEQGAYSGEMLTTLRARVSEARDLERRRAAAP